jgi:hypothetical protein
LVPIPILVVLAGLRSEADNDGSDIPGEIIDGFEDLDEELFDIYDEYEDDLYDISDEFEGEVTDIAAEGIEEYELWYNAIILFYEYIIDEFVRPLI